MNDFSKKVKDTFIKISELAYELLEVTGEPIRQVHEDGISSIILKKIARLKDEGIYVKTQSLQVNESKTGIDFNLWIGENDDSYIRLIIQAKSFHNQKSVEKSYSIDKEQCDKILDQSKIEHEAFPMYFLYQHIIDDDLKKNHFAFLKDFKHEYSSITFTSAKNMKVLIENEELKFSEIHKNDFGKRWNNDIYSLFELDDRNIGLPFYLLHDISPSKIEKFKHLISTKNNSLGFFFFFFFGENYPFKIHKITAKQIEEKYGNNNPDHDVQFKNLIIINDNMKLRRDREETLQELLK